MGAKEGESIELKCRLEEEMEEGECTVTWSFNETVITENERFMISFDGTYAKLFVSSLIMEDMGAFKVKFENEKGSDESTGKVTVKPAPIAKPKIEEKSLTPPPAPKEEKKYKIEIKKKDKKEPAEEPKPEEKAEAPEDMFKLKKKSSVTRKPPPPKEEEEQQAPFAGLKLKKTETVKRTWEDKEMEKVELKHHEFEIEPQSEEVELNTSVILEQLIDADGVKKKKKKKK